jgi:hypothetical protein
MKKKTIFITLFILIMVGFIVVVSYKNHVVKRTDIYVKQVEQIMKRQGIFVYHKRVSMPWFPDSIMKDQPYWVFTQERIRVEEIIKRTPTELVMLIRWGCDGRAYVNIKNWLTRKHDRITIYPLDPTWGIKVYE